MPLRLIQVGLGGMGRHWATHVIPQQTDVELVACVESVPEVLELARAKLPAPTAGYFTSLEDALEQVNCQAVLITTNLEAHVPCALMALQAGKHVLMEKPFAPTLAEARQLVEMARSLQLVLAICQNYRYYPAVQKVRELIQSEELGPIGNVTVDFRKYSNTAPKENVRQYTNWEPLLVDMSVHHFDLMRYILRQEATQIFCQTWHPTWSNFREPASGVATVTFDGGTIVNYRGSWVSTGPETSWAGEWHIECARGEIAIQECRGAKPDQVTVQILGEEARHVPLPVLPFSDWGGALDAFTEAVRTNQEPGISGRDNLQTLALTLAAVEAAARKPPQVTLLARSIQASPS